MQVLQRCLHNSCFSPPSLSFKQCTGLILAWRTILTVAFEPCLYTVYECATSYACGNRSALPVPALLEVIKGVWSDQPTLDSLIVFAI